LSPVKPCHVHCWKYCERGSFDVHVFDLFILFGLGVTALAMFAESILNVAQEQRALVLVGIGVSLAWGVDFNLWSLWHFHARAG
jgi:hypothetical protein